MYLFNSHYSLIFALTLFTRISINWSWFCKNTFLPLETNIGGDISSADIPKTGRQCQQFKLTDWIFWARLSFPSCYIFLTFFLIRSCCPYIQSFHRYVSFVWCYICQKSLLFNFLYTERKTLYYTRLFL